MEKLQRRSDGIAETSSGLFAVSPTRVSAQTSDLNVFTFRPSVVSEPVEVRWRKDDGIAVIEQSVARMMLDRRYAEQATDEQVARWNAMIDELDPDAKNPLHILPDSDEKAPEVLEEGSEAGAAEAAGEGAGETGQSATEGASEPLQQPQATQVATGTATAPEGGSEGTEKPGEEGSDANDNPEGSSSEGDQPSDGEKPEEENTNGQEASSKKSKGKPKGSLL